MDNSPRNRYLGMGVDITSEMVLFAKQLLAILDILEEKAYEVEEVKERREMLIDDRCKTIQAINRYMWNEADGFYYDVDFEGRQTGIKTIADFSAQKKEGKLGIKVETKDCFNLRICYNKREFYFEVTGNLEVLLDETN